MTPAGAPSRANLRRCQWASGEDPTNPLVPYHDDEWGRPSRDDRHLFEMLCLEGAQVMLWPSAMLRIHQPATAIHFQPLQHHNSHAVAVCALPLKTAAMRASRAKGWQGAHTQREGCRMDPSIHLPFDRIAPCRRVSAG